MAVFNDRVFLVDTLPRVSRDRALSLSRSQKYTRHNQRRFTARLARSSILSANESPGDFKLKVLQQIEEDIDGGAIEEVRVLLTTNFLIYSSMHRRWDRIKSMVIQRSKNIIIFHLQGKMPINLIPVYYHASSILNYGFDQASISDTPVWYQDTSRVWGIDLCPVEYKSTRRWLILVLIVSEMNQLEFSDTKLACMCVGPL